MVASGLLGVLGTDEAAHEPMEVVLLQHGALWKERFEDLQIGANHGRLACMPAM
jgi:hypothetical protein